MNNIKKFFNKKQFKYGAYAIAMTAVVVAVVIIVNVLITTVDNKFNLSFDLTANKVYSLTQKTDHILEELDQDIYIFTLSSNDYNDKFLIELLERYKTKSEYIHIKDINISKNPGFVSFYQDEKNIPVTIGGVIITTSADTTDPTQSFKIVNYNELYSYNQEAENNSLFTGEDAITGSINYVLNPNIPKVWFLEGHGATSENWYEMSLILNDENYKTEGISLLTEPENLETGDILVIVAPSDDLSNEEREVLLDFALDGGKIMFLFDPLSSIELPNLMLVLSHYNISLEDGMVIEDIASKDGYLRTPINLLPTIYNFEITSPLIVNQLNVGTPNAGALVLGPKLNGIEIEVLLESSETSFIEPISANMNLEMNDDAIRGPFPIFVAAIKNATEDTEEAKIIVSSSAASFQYFSQIETPGNYELFLNMVSWFSPYEDDFYIRGKSLQTSVLYFQTQTQVNIVKAIATSLIPILAFVLALVIYLKRRHL